MSIKSQIESLLFISHKPLRAKELANLLAVEIAAVEPALIELAGEYQTRAGGMMILVNGDSYQMTTSGESSEVVQKFLKNEVTGELTRPSLETLTIIAYRGPVSKAELELIRGVNCSMIIRNLLMRGLIEGREDKEKMTTVYTVTMDFLKYLGLSRLEDLPDYGTLNRSHTLDALLGQTNVDLPIAGDDQSVEAAE